MSLIKKGTLLCLCLLLMLLATSALAMSQTEWNQQCTNKIAWETTVYDEDGNAKGTIPGGSYVITGGYNAATGRWRVTYYSGGGTASGFVDGSSVTVAIASVRVDDGTVETIPEALSGNYSAIASYLNTQYSDRTFTASGSSIHVVKEEGADDSGAARRTPQITNIMPVPEELLGVKELGSIYSLVTEDGVDRRVLTSTIPFSDELPPSKQIAMISATRTGVATMHTQPKAKSSVLDKLTTGLIVGVIKPGKSYTRIFANGKVGCVLTETLVTLDVDAEPLGYGIITVKGKVAKGDWVNVRGGPSAKSRIVDSWYCGTEVTVWAHENSFYEIEAKGLRVYINDKFLTMQDEAPDYASPEAEEEPADDDAGEENEDESSEAIDDETDEEDGEETGDETEEEDVLTVSVTLVEQAEPEEEEAEEASDEDPEDDAGPSEDADVPEDALDHVMELMDPQLDMDIQGGTENESEDIPEDLSETAPTEAAEETAEVIWAPLIVSEAPVAEPAPLSGPSGSAGAGHGK
ncbi:MAG: hypothetical protein IJ083_14645 [Clostridia bacterium]|nr:hypothetical protein [Clostridia bacterium]